MEKYNGVVLVCDGFYWWLLNPIGKMPKHNRKRNDLMVIMGIVLVLMETIMVSTVCDGFLLVGC